MFEASKRELEFISGLITAGSRLDTRTNKDQRTFIFKDNIRPKSDRSLYLKQGFTEIEINIAFKSTPETLEHLNYSKSAYKTIDVNDSIVELYIKSRDGSDLFIKNINDKNPVFESLKELFSSFKLGIIVELIVINNDGNIFDLFFRGLNEIFSEILIPNVDNLNKDFPIKHNLPISKTYAIVNNTILYDPTLLEELSSNAIIHIFLLEDTKYTIVDGKPIKYENITNILELLEEGNESLSVFSN